MSYDDLDDLLGFDDEMTPADVKRIRRVAANMRVRQAEFQRTRTLLVKNALMGGKLPPELLAIVAVGSRYATTAELRTVGLEAFV